MTDLLESVETGLFIGGRARQTDDRLAVADPGRPDLVVGYAAAASPSSTPQRLAAQAL